MKPARRLRPAGLFFWSIQVNDDQKRRLQEAQRHLADAARAIDGATVHIRGVLADNDKPKPTDHGPNNGDDDAR